MADVTQCNLFFFFLAGFAAPAEGELLCARLPELVSDIEAWDALAGCAAEPNPFFESWYLLPSLERLRGRGDAQVLCFRRNGALCGLMPIVRQQHYHGWPVANLANWLHPNMFLGTPLIVRHAEERFWRALLGWADANPGLSLFLHLHGMALDGPVFAALQAVLAGEGRPWAVIERKERAMLRSGPGAEARLAGALPSRNRKDLERRLRRLGELGAAEFCWETGAEGIAPWIAEFLALEAQGWKGEAGSALACDPATESLFRAALTGAAMRDRLVRLSLRLDGRPIAMLSTFVAAPGSFGFKTAFDEDYARFAPGLLLEREFLTALDRFGLSWCDSCAAPDHSVMNRIWHQRRSIGRVSIGIGGPIRRAAFAQLLRKKTARLTTGTPA